MLALSLWNAHIGACVALATYLISVLYLGIHALSQNKVFLIIVLIASYEELLSGKLINSTNAIIVATFSRKYQIIWF